MPAVIDRAGIAALHDQVLGELSAPGDWLPAPCRRAAMEEARAASACTVCAARRATLSPDGAGGRHVASGILSEAAVEVIHRVVGDSGRLTRRWAASQIAALGDAVYAELVAVTAIIVAIDVYARAIGSPLPELHEPLEGAPAGERPEGVGDVGAWIPMTEQKLMANVSRALSLVPLVNTTWRTLVNESYSRGPQMLSSTWERALTRPQVELIAARVSQLNECFY